MITCSAPGKIYLFGEHAVVYGENAICCAVDIRTRVMVEPHDGVAIVSVLGTTGLDHDIHPYVSAVVERMSELASFDGLQITIRSDIPVGSGLGSSAAVTVATIKALDVMYNCGLDNVAIASMGHEIEMSIQGAASPTDTYVCTMGGVIRIPQRRSLESLDCGIIIGNTHTYSSTRELVGRVADLRQRYPDVISPILSSIGNLSSRGEELVNSRSYMDIGDLMNINQGLLDAIGVGSARLSSLVHAASAAGAMGAKITGAGGGGCMVALADLSHVKDVADAILAAGGDPIITETTKTGLRVDSST
ncbi:MAG: mevalonate kinase [Euryarchaeota archaeon]|nr:mevalonate kinase [Euryarchaeota archaeon]